LTQEIIDEDAALNLAEIEFENAVTVPVRYQALTVDLPVDCGDKRGCSTSHPKYSVRN